MEIEEKKEVSWNILRERAQYIATLLWRTTNYLAAYKYERAYSSLSGLRELINCDLNETDRTELDILEKKMRYYICQLFKYKNNPNGTFDDKKRITNNLCSNLVREYQRKLMDCLKKQGYFPLKKDERFLGGKR